MKYLKIFKNWRIIALTVMALAALILIIGESNNPMALVAVKLLGFMLGTFCYKIGKDWHDKGFINEIDELNNEAKE